MPRDLAAQYPLICSHPVAIFKYQRQSPLGFHAAGRSCNAFPACRWRRLVSHAAVNQRRLDHHGKTWWVYGLSTVFTYPDRRGRALPRRSSPRRLNSYATATLTWQSSSVASTWRISTFATAGSRLTMPAFFMAIPHPSTKNRQSHHDAARLFGRPTIPPAIRNRRILRRPQYMVILKKDRPPQRDHVKITLRCPLYAAMAFSVSHPPG